MQAHTRKKGKGLLLTYWLNRSKKHQSCTNGFWVLTIGNLAKKSDSTKAFWVLFGHKYTRLLINKSYKNMPFFMDTRKGVCNLRCLIALVSWWLLIITKLWPENRLRMEKLESFFSSLSFAWEIAVSQRSNFLTDRIFQDNSQFWLKTFNTWTVTNGTTVSWGRMSDIKPPNKKQKLLYHTAHEF